MYSYDNSYNIIAELIQTLLANEGKLSYISISRSRLKMFLLRHMFVIPFFYSTLNVLKLSQCLNFNLSTYNNLMLVQYY